MKKLMIVMISLSLLSACSKSEDSSKNNTTTKQEKGDQMIETSSGLKYSETPGNGDEATAGKKVTVHYTGWLYENGQKGQKFDSSVDRGQPFSFVLGAGRVIKGWDEGVAGMKVGGKRTLIIPSDLGYGSRGAGAAIPPNATLLFDVELLKVE